MVVGCQVKFKAKHKLKGKTYFISGSGVPGKGSPKFPTLEQCPSLSQISPTSLYLKVTPSEMCCSTYAEEQVQFFLTPPTVPREAKPQTKGCLSNTTFLDQQTALNCTWREEPKLNLRQRSTPFVARITQVGSRCTIKLSVKGCFSV